VAKRKSNHSAPATLVREDVRETVLKGVKALAQTEKQNRQRNMEAYEKQALGVADTIYFNIKKVPSRRGEPDRVQATAISGLPSTEDTCVAFGRDADEALFEARHQLLDVFWNNRLPGTTWTSVRYRACVAKLEIFSMDMDI